MNFRSWLLSQHDREDAVGALARDTLLDVDCWRGEDFDSLRRHLILFHDVHPEDLAVLDQAYGEYLRGVKASA